MTCYRPSSHLTWEALRACGEAPSSKGFAGFAIRGNGLGSGGRLGSTKKTWFKKNSMGSFRCFSFFFNAWFCFFEELFGQMCWWFISLLIRFFGLICLFNLCMYLFILISIYSYFYLPFFLFSIWLFIEWQFSDNHFMFHTSAWRVTDAFPPFFFSS